MVMERRLLRPGRWRGAAAYGRDDEPCPFDGLTLADLIALCLELDGTAPAPSALLDAGPAEPTDAPPGSPEKIEVLADRASRRRQLFHAADCAVVYEPGEQPGRARDQHNRGAVRKALTAPSVDGVVAQALRDCWSVRQLAAALGCSPAAAQNRLRAARGGGRPDHRRGRSHAMLQSSACVETLRAGLRQGVSATQLARQLGLSVGAVARRMRALRGEAAAV